MVADTAVPREEYTLIIRQYNIGITRLFLGFGEYELTDQSEMLQFSERIRRVPLSVEKQGGKWILFTQMDEACRYQCRRAGFGPMERVTARSSGNTGHHSVS